MDDKPVKRLGLAALAFAALTSPVLVRDANAANGRDSHGAAPPGDNAVVLGNKHKPQNNNYVETGNQAGHDNAIVLGRKLHPRNNNFVEQSGSHAQNNNAIVLGNDGRPLDNNRYVIGRDGKYHDAQRNNTVIILNHPKPDQ